MFNTMMDDFNSMSKFWKGWMISGLVIVLLTACYSFNGFNLSFMVNVVAGLSSVCYVVNAACDKKSAMIFGSISVLLYGLISLNAKIYGDAMQNLLYQFPVLIIGLSTFDKRGKKDTKKCILCNIYVSSTLYVCLLVLYALTLEKLGDISPILDSFTTITSMFAIVLLSMRNKYQWVLWVGVNAVSSYMWYSIGGISIMSMMWMFYLLNSFIGLYINFIKKK